jgi:DNA-directed RNA polymerase specialized sigma24 family protein
MQQAYVELPTGKARFGKKSSLKTFVFSVAQNPARSRYRRIASRPRLPGGSVFPMLTGMSLRQTSAILRSAT